MTIVVLYGRQDCCLCDQAREVVLRVRERHPFELQERDIESDDALLRTYLERIPVVTIDGVEEFELFVDEERLAQRMQCASEQLSAPERPGSISRVQPR